MSGGRKASARSLSGENKGHRGAGNGRPHILPSPGKDESNGFVSFIRGLVPAFRR